MSLDILKEMLEDEDALGLIRADAYPDTYDPCAEYIFPKLSKDLSIEQIQRIIWDSFYENFCVCTIAATNEPWILDKEQAIFILGSPNRYREIAFNIRHSIIGL